MLDEMEGWRTVGVLLGHAEVGLGVGEVDVGLEVNCGGGGGFGDGRWRRRWSQDCPSSFLCQCSVMTGGLVNGQR